MNIPQATRAYIYRIVTGVFAVLVFKGIITADEAPLWLEIGESVLGLGVVGLAARNTPTN